MAVRCCDTSMYTRDHHEKEIPQLDERPISPAITLACFIKFQRRSALPNFMNVSQNITSYKRKQEDHYSGQKGEFGCYKLGDVISKGDLVFFHVCTQPRDQMLPTRSAKTANHSRKNIHTPIGSALIYYPPAL
mgnify:CR=1 FL=1